MDNVETISPGGMESVRRVTLRAAWDSFEALGLPPEMVSAALQQYTELVAPIFGQFPDIEVTLPAGMTEQEFQKARPMLDQVKAATRGHDWGHINHLAEQLVVVLGAYYKSMHDCSGSVSILSSAPCSES